MLQIDSDIIIKNSNKNYFQIRINQELRTKGIYQIRGYKEYLDIEFKDGYTVSVFYPDDMEELYTEVEQELLLETRLSKSHIDKIKYYVKDCTFEIENEIKNL